MNRPLAYVTLAAAVAAGGCNRPADPPQDLALEVKMADDADKAKDADRKAGKPKPEPEPVRVPTVMKRWPVPVWIPIPDKYSARGSVWIDPTGPCVVYRSASGGLLSWNPAAGGTTPGARVAGPGTVIRDVRTEKKGWVVEVHDRKTDRKLLELKDVPTRDACVTPDGHRLLTVGRPGVYQGYQVIKIPSGDSYWHPPEPVKNVRLYDLASGEERGKFWPGEYKLDDDVWAVAPAPDGKSFFLLSRKYLAQVHFEGAFDVAPWPPQPR